MSKVALILLLCFAPFACAQSPRVKIDSGTLLGTSDGKIDSFKGIPYAKAPLGTLRWRPPQPAENWKGERAATNFGAACSQQNPPEEATGKPPETNEDCLTLNVWTPSHHDHLLPVMVWIHGGRSG